MPAKPSAERSGRHAPRAIGEMAGRLLAKPLGKRGLAASSLAGDWAAIVGPALASHTLPLRVAFPRGARNDATLHMRVASGSMALELKHLEPLIIERVNVHFGYAAVARIAIVQGPVPQRAPARKTPPPAKPAVPLDSGLAEQIESVADPELREALEGLGRRLAQTWQRP